MAREQLRLEITEPAEAQIDEAYTWLVRIADYQAAEKWMTAFTNAVENEARTQAVLPVLRPSPVPSERVAGIDLRQLLFRSPGGSSWHVLYELVDADEDSAIDTLRIHRVRHAARSTDQGD